jgi:ketosteroid isomerase-like protein
MAAAREGDFEALLRVLDPDVVLRQETGDGPVRVLRGAEVVAGQARAYSQLDLVIHDVLVTGAVGAVSTTRDGRLFSVGAITVRNGRIVEMDFWTDPERLAQLDLTALDR